MTTNRFLTVPEVAAELRVDPATVRRWITAGQLPATKPGRDYRVKRTDVQHMLDSRRISSPMAADR